MATLADALRQTGYSQDGALAVPASTEPTMTSILQKHIASLPQQLATNQQAMDNTMASMYKTDMATGQPNPNYRPEAMNEFTQMMPNVGALTAWHGTPHAIKGAFDINKVGTGEGAQAYGHGIYFAESPEIAKGFINAGKPANTRAKTFLDLHENDIDRALEAANKSLEMTNSISPANRAGAIKSAKDLIDELEVIKNPKQLGLIDKLKGKTQGNLYKVDIPDEQIPNMLDWDKPLTQQTPEVQAILKDRFPSAFDDPRQATGQALYKEQVKKMGLVGQKNPEQFMSNYLNEYGIKGIRYLDEGSRKTGGTSNFVVFDPSIVKILEENGKPVSRKEIIEKQIKSLKE